MVIPATRIALDLGIVIPALILPLTGLRLGIWAVICLMDIIVFGLNDSLV